MTDFLPRALRRLWQKHRLSQLLQRLALGLGHKPREQHADEHHDGQNASYETRAAADSRRIVRPGYAGGVAAVRLVPAVDAAEVK